jgi:thiamine-phosphate pyrophosphorylase
LRLLFQRKMALNLQPPLCYVITNGATTPQTTPASEEFQRILELVSAAVRAHVSLIQLREKNLPARTLFELASQCAALTRGTKTRLLVNDRADIARAARADGVHLSTRSLEPSIIRRAFGPDFLIGASTHSLAEAKSARDGGADFAVLGPIFDTPSKRAYGAPLGLDSLSAATEKLSPFPLIALGGITRDNAAAAFRAGAYGVAAIRLFADADRLEAIAAAIHGQRIET